MRERGCRCCRVRFPESTACLQITTLTRTGEPTHHT
jgi:hypothetical protein